MMSGKWSNIKMLLSIIVLFFLADFTNSITDTTPCNAFAAWSNEDLPIDIYIHPSVPIEMLPTIHKAITDFNKQTGRTFYRLSGVSEATLNMCEGFGDIICPQKDMENTIYYIPYNITHVGMTQTKHKDLKILEIDIFMNKNIDYGFNDEYPVSSEYLYSTMLYELAHGIGMKHTNNKNDLMYESSNINNVINSFNKKELSQIKCNYKDIYAN